jgi:hypothetical protein
MNSVQSDENRALRMFRAGGIFAPGRTVANVSGNPGKIADPSRHAIMRLRAAALLPPSYATTTR